VRWQDQRIKSGTEWEVSKIVGRRLYENTIQFEVLWKGWRGTTWEPYDMLKNTCDQKLQDFIKDKDKGNKRKKAHPSRDGD